MLTGLAGAPCMRIVGRKLDVLAAKIGDGMGTSFDAVMGVRGGDGAACEDEWW